MASFYKVHIGVPLTPDQHKLAKRAARIEGNRRGRSVSMADLFREAALPSLERIVAESQPVQHATGNA